MICTNVCSVAWLKITKLCPCLSYFLGFFSHFERLAFFENGGTNFTPKESKRLLSRVRRYRIPNFCRYRRTHTFILFCFQAGGP